MTRPPDPRTFAGERGFTLVEVVVSLVIVASAFIPLLVSLGSASERVLDTVLHRKMRYLMQLQAADVELVKVKPDEEEERYEEGQTGDFRGFASSDNPDEYDHFQYSIEAYRDEVIVGGDDEKALLDAGFETDAAGNIVGRPVSNDTPKEDGTDGPPPGQMKRLLVLAVRHLGETADDDLEFKILTYLPMPDEEDRQVGADAGQPGGPGGPGGDQKGAAGGDGGPRKDGGSAGGDKK